MIRTIFFMFCSLLLNSQESILNIGHRGAKGHIAENTIASIHKAIELGADGIEIDVFLCKSGEIVLFHDKTLEKLTYRKLGDTSQLEAMAQEIERKFRN